MHKYFLSIILALLFSSCEKQPISHEVVFSAKLGFEENQIGSNVPILSSYTNRGGFPDSFLIDIPKPIIHENHIYIADSYNKKISIFAIRESNDLVMSIANEGDGYAFARPYEVFIGLSNEIYVLSSIQDFESYEVQNYSNQTANIGNYSQFQRDLDNIPDENFNIFKFSPEGEFLLKLDSQNFYYPSSVNVDNLGNTYIGYDYITNDQKQTLIYRYDSLGKKDLEFDTVILDMQTNINDIHYTGTINSINNFKNQEVFALMIQYQPTTNSTGEYVPALIDNIIASLAYYNIPDKTFSVEEVSYSNVVESILGVDTNDRLFLQSYDTELDALKVRIHTDEKSYIYHTPTISSYYALFDYFIDSNGNLYNYILDGATKLIVLQWFIEKDEKESQSKNSEKNSTDDTTSENPESKKE